MAGWSNLPAELAAAVADKLTELADLARFRSVCPSWRAASAAHAGRRGVPLLLLPSDDYNSDVVRHLLSISDDHLIEAPLPAAHGLSFLFASTHGWALGVGESLSAVLVHLFTGASAALPALPSPFRKNADDGLRDMLWDWSPHGVMASPGKGAVLCRPGNAEWTPVGALKRTKVSSITYRDGSFYLLDGSTCKTTVVDAASLAVAIVIKRPPALRIPKGRFEANLAVSSGELLLLVRTMVLHPGWVNFDNVFKAFRMDRRGESPEWSEVAGAGDRAVFVDHFRAFCVEANEHNGLRRNCIYFASAYEEVNDDYMLDVYGKYTVTVLDLADVKNEQLLQFRAMRYFWSSRFWQWPSWAIPSLP